MPHPDGEVVRVAVEKALHEGLADMGGDWIATDSTGREYEFRPAAEFEVGTCLGDDELDSLPDDHPAERVYRLRVRVELVEVVDE